MTPSSSSSSSNSSSSSFTSGDPAAAFPFRPPSPSPPPAPPSGAGNASSRRFPAPCWTADEAHALVDSYRDKWYSLRRGNLRATHWQEVADAVVRRCRNLPAATPKTALQCRHKIEKLRKRYRSERRRSISADPAAPPSSPWILFRKMDAMERGDGGFANLSDDGDDDDEDEDPPAFRGGAGGSGSRSISRLLENGGGTFKAQKAVRRSGNPNCGPNFQGFRDGVNKPPAAMAAGEMRRVAKRKKGSDGGEEGGAVREMIYVLRMLGERFMLAEQMKMEQAREMERARMEVKLKRTEMILDSQRRIVDAFVQGFAGKKRAKAEADEP